MVGVSTVAVGKDVLVAGSVFVGKGVFVAGSVFVGKDVLVAGTGVFDGDATTMDTVSVEPNAPPACVPSLHVPTYEPGCFGAIS